jgi:glycosyltransferase involved in cell wall biosynthesis
MDDGTVFEAIEQLPAGAAVSHAAARLAPTSIVIPAVNEAENLPYILTAIPSLPDIMEVVLVDGNSTDHTVSVAQRCLPSIRIVHQNGRGKSDAIRCGVAAAAGDYVLVMDADGSHDPADIPRFIECARSGHDLVKGSRYLPGGGSEDHTPLRRVLVWVTDVVANILWGSRFTDIVFGMLLMHRQSFLDLGLTSNGFSLETQTMARAKRRGYRIVEIPIVEKSRLAGVSRLHVVRDGWYIGSTVFVEFFHRVTREAFMRRPVPHGVEVVSESE